MSFQPLEGLLGRLGGGGIFGQPQNPGGLLGAAVLQDAQKRSQLAMAAALLQASGPSPQKIGLGQALGGALMAGQQAGDQASQQAIQAELLKRQMQPKPIEVSRGASLYDPAKGQVIYTAPGGSEVDQPSSVREYQYAVNNGFKGSFQDWISAGGQSSRPSAITVYEYFKNLPPAEQKAMLETMRAPTVKEVGGVNSIISQGGVNPLTTLQAEAEAQARLAREKAAGTATGEAQGATASKAPAVASMDYVLKEFEQVLPTTPQGGVMGIGGKIGGVTNYKDAARFDNLREQLSTELRTVYRIPGEGTLSNQEQAQYGLQLPDRNNPREVNEAILRDLRERTRLRTQTPIGPSQPTQSAQPPKSQPRDVNSLLDKYAPKK